MAKSKAELLAEKMQRERVGQAAYEAGMKPAIETTVAPVEDQPVAENNKPAEEKKPEKKAKDVKATPKEAPATKEKKTDLLAGLGKKKVEKKAFGYYLSVANDEKLKRAANTKGVSVSELLDYIITNLDI